MGKIRGCMLGLKNKTTFMKRQVVAGIADSETKWKRFSYSVGVFVTGFLVAFFAASLVAKPGDAAADDTDTTTVTASGYSLTLTATSEVNLGLRVSDNDSMTVGLGNISVTTNSPGYNLYIGMSGDTTALNGIADGISGSIAAVSGTITAPAALTRGTWGYAIPRNTAHVVSNAFATTYTPMSSGTPDSGQTFAVPPISSTNPQLIATSNAAATSGDNYPIYYGVRANADTAPGEYSNKVLFTAVADAAATHSMTLSPVSANVNAATTLAVTTSLYSTAGYANANIYLLTASQYNSISGTNVEALGVSPLTCAKSGNTPVAYSCSVTAPSTQGEYYIYAKFPVYNVTYASVFNVYNPVTLTVNPNGGTWNGSTSTQTFTQNQGSTKTISNPTAGPTYTITYNANGQGAAYSGTPTSVQRSFSSWSVSGGSLSGTTYTFGSTAGTLTANYNTTSNSFTLPAITKNGNNCYWAEGSTSGTQYAGGTSRTITGDKTYYAICDTPAFFKITTMQEMTSAVCNSVVTPSASATQTDTTGAYTSLSNANTNYVAQRTLSDTRDSNTYIVRKLADGNCWMVQNLRLVGSKTLTSANSDVTANFTLPASATSGWSAASAHVYNTNNTTYGVLYNWNAATAGIGSSSTPNSGYIDSSICPKNWMLPHGDIWNKNFWYLFNNAYKYYVGAGSSNFNSLFSSPFDFTLSGNMSSDSRWYNSAQAAQYWNNYVDAYGNASYLFLQKSNSGINTAGGGNRYTDGSAVRCLAR